MIYFFVSTHQRGGEGKSEPQPLRKRFRGVSRENPVPRAAPEVTVTLAWRWPVYQSEMKISVRCQSGECWGGLGRGPGWTERRAGPSFPTLQQRPGHLTALIAGQQANVSSLIKLLPAPPLPRSSPHLLNRRKGSFCLQALLAARPSLSLAGKKASSCRSPGLEAQGEPAPLSRSRRRESGV